MHAPETSPTYPVPTIATRIVSAPQRVTAARRRAHPYQLRLGRPCANVMRYRQNTCRSSTRPTDPLFGVSLRRPSLERMLAAKPHGGARSPAGHKEVARGQGYNAD